LNEYKQIRNEKNMFLGHPIGRKCPMKPCEYKQCAYHRIPTWPVEVPTKANLQTCELRFTTVSQQVESLSKMESWFAVVW
jgi:hypothetical protein